MKYAVVIVLFAFAVGGAYFLGRSHAELKVIKEKVEVIKYVDRKRAEIHARPNVSRDELLKLMRAGQL
mgnify:CR=1 FL=1